MNLQYFIIVFLIIRLIKIVTILNINGVKPSNNLNFNILLCANIFYF